MFTVDYELGGAAQAHDHPFEEAYVFLAGEVEGELDGQHYTFRPGDVAFAGVGSVHGFYNTGTERVRWIETQAPAAAGPARLSLGRRLDAVRGGADMSTDGCIVVVGGTAGHRRGARPPLRRHRARDGPDRPRPPPGATRSPRRSAAPRRGIALDLAEPKTIRDALSSVGPVRYLAIVAIERDDNTIREFDIDRALRLVTLKLVGYAEVVHVLLDRLAPDSSIVLFGGQAKDRPYPGSTTVSDGQRRDRRARPDAREGAGADPGQRDPPGDRRRQPVLARQAAGDPRRPPVEDDHQAPGHDGRHRRRHALPAREPVRRRRRPRGRQRPA